MKTDVLVIGGGLAGVSTFYALASRGVEVTLIEGEAEAASGASYANGAMLTPSMSDPWNGPGVGKHLAASLFDSRAAMRLRLSQLPALARWGTEFLRNSTPARHMAATEANFSLAQYSLRETQRLATELNLAVADSPRGTLKIFESIEAMSGPTKLARRLEDAGLQFHILDVAATLAVEPALTPVADRIAGAIHYPDDAVGDARRYTLGLAAAACKSGGILRCGAPAGAISRSRDGFRVMVGDDVVMAQRIVIAAGHASPAISRKLGFRLPIAPAKGYSLTYRLEAGDDIPSTAIVDDAMHAAVVPIGGDRIRAVGTAEFAGADRRVDRQRIENLASLFARVYPTLARRIDRTAAVGWAGLRPMSADGRPFIGAAEVPGVWVNAGHGHLGWTMAAGSARLLARMMLGDTPEIVTHPFAIGSARS